MIKIALAALCFTWFITPETNKPFPDAIVYPLVDSLKTDTETSLVIDNQLMLVKAQCTGCHSSKLITQNRFTREGWKEKIRWMQRTQKL